MQDMKKMGCWGCFIGLFATPFVVIADLVRKYSGSGKR